MEVPGRKDEGNVDTKHVLHCDLCKLLSKTEDAEHFCTDCNEFFCNDCFAVHRVSKLSRTHTVLPKDEMPDHKLISTEDTSCVLHDGVVIAHFCKTHTEFLCSVCLSHGHKECTVENLDEIAVDYDLSDEYKSLMGNIPCLTQQLQEIANKATSKRPSIQRNHEQLVVDVEKFRSDTHEMINALVNSTLAEALSLKEENIDSVETAVSSCYDMIGKLEEKTSTMEHQAKYRQLRQLVMSAKQAQIKMKEFENETNYLSEKCKIRKYKFLPNGKLIDLVDSIDRLGDIMDKEKEKWIEVNAEATVDTTVTSNPQSVQASFIGQINVKHSEEVLDCKITGSALLDESRIAVVDYENRSAKVVDVKNNIITSYLKLNVSPLDVTLVETDLLAATCPRDNKIVFLQARDTLHVTKEIIVVGSCGGIVCTNNKLIVSFVSPNPAIKVLSLNGEVLQSFSEDSNGVPLFKTPVYLGLSYDKATLFVIDKSNGSVTSMDMDGEILNVYVDEKMSVPRGMAADKHGNMYIAGRWSENVHQISTRCKLLQILLDRSQGVQRPMSMTYCEKENKLYISHIRVMFGRYKDNRMSVYQLHYGTS